MTYVAITYEFNGHIIFFCRSYCLLNMFRAPLCPSSGAREYYTSGCLSYLVLWFSSCRYGVELRFVCPVCGLLPANRTHIRHSETSTILTNINILCFFFHCFTVHFDSLSFIHINSRTFSYNYVSVF